MTQILEFPIKTRAVTVKQDDILLGLTIHVARVPLFGGRPYLETFEVRSTPFAQGDDPLAKWIKVGNHQAYRSEISLRDAGVIENDYNLHRTFFDVEDAHAYLDRIESGQFTDDERKKVAMIQRNKKLYIDMMGY